MNTEKKINWAILVTGWGRSAKQLINMHHKKYFRKSHIKVLIYENEPCGAMELATKRQIETLQIKKNDFHNTQSYQNQLIKEIKARDIDYIFLLNYHYIIKDEMLKAFPNKILNIHPSLFPSFIGTKTAIQDAMAHGVKITGITTHIIDDNIDEGIILCQEAIKINEYDTFESLYLKFVKKGKKIILKTVRMIESQH